MYVHIVKPLVGKLIALIVFLLFWWVYVVIAIAILIDDPGPVFFQQKRVGKKKNGEITYFQIYKFRTMKQDTPKDVPTHLLENPEQYITSVGKFLRRTSLDEIPQIFNILKGDLAWVGPRPALYNQEDLIREREKYKANDCIPGITGWAQVNGRDELSIEEKAAFDGEYASSMQTHPFRMDMRCIWKSIRVVLQGTGNREQIEAGKSTAGAET